MFLTSRNEGLRDVTKTWLKVYFDLDVKDEDLLMRPTGDLTIPSLYKRRQLSTLFYRFPPNHGWLAIDDDDHMTTTYLDFKAIPLKAPGCWDFIAKIVPNLPPEVAWRK